MCVIGSVGGKAGLGGAGGKVCLGAGDMGFM